MCERHWWNTERANFCFAMFVLFFFRDQLHRAEPFYRNVGLKPKGRYSTLSNSPLVPILSQMNPIHILPSHCYPLSSILQYIPTYSKWYPSFTCSHQNPASTFLANVCHTPFHSRHPDFITLIFGMYQSWSPLLFPPPPQVKTFSSPPPRTWIPSAYVLRIMWDHKA
jgi:hypothetical protein